MALEEIHNLDEAIERFENFKSRMTGENAHIIGEEMETIKDFVLENGGSLSPLFPDKDTLSETDMEEHIKKLVEETRTESMHQLLSELEDFIHSDECDEEPILPIEGTAEDMLWYLEEITADGGKIPQRTVEHMISTANHAIRHNNRLKAIRIINEIEGGFFDEEAYEGETDNMANQARLWFNEAQKDKVTLDPDNLQITFNDKTSENSSSTPIPDGVERRIQAAVSRAKKQSPFSYENS